MPIRWRDIDPLGHVNQSVYHELLEEGRGALFAPLIEIADGFFFVLARVELDYRHEIRHSDGEVEIATVVERLGRTSVVVTHAIRLADGTLAAERRSVLVAWDGAARRARELAAAERDLLGS